jgi:hypothetical protein
MLGKNLPAFLQHLAAFYTKCAFRALQHVAYGIDSAMAYCRIQQRSIANYAFTATRASNAFILLSFFCT